MVLAWHGCRINLCLHLFLSPCFSIIALENWIEQIIVKTRIFVKWYTYLILEESLRGYKTIM
jgi:hypothetical protein